MCVDQVVGTVLVRDEAVLKENQQDRIAYFILSIHRRVSYLGPQSLLGTDLELIFLFLLHSNQSLMQN